MSYQRILAMVMAISLTATCIAQEEQPLEPIPLPAPVAKADDGADADNIELNIESSDDALDYDEVVMPLDGPVFPESENVQASYEEETPLEPVEMGAAVEMNAPSSSPAASNTVVAPNYVAPSTPASNTPVYNETVRSPESVVVPYQPPVVQPQTIRQPTNYGSPVIHGPVVNGSPVVRGPVVNSRVTNSPVTYGQSVTTRNEVVATPQNRTQSGATNYYVAPGQPQQVVVEQTYYQPGNGRSRSRYQYQGQQRQEYQVQVYQQNQRRNAGVAVYRADPYTGRTATVEVTPVNYMIQVQQVGPYSAFRPAPFRAGGFGPGVAPGMIPGMGPMGPGMLAPPAFVPGQPVRNAIRSMGW